VKPSVLVALPNEGWIHRDVALRLPLLLGDSRVRASVTAPVWRPYEHALARITQQLLEEGQDYLLVIDADNPPRNNPLDLVDLDLDVVGCPTPIWRPGSGYPICWNAMDRVEDGWREHAEKAGLQEVDAVGSGCVLIARRVLASLEAPWVRVWDERGFVAEGTDFAFCRRAKAAGWRVWAHYDYPCEHHREVGLIQASLSFQGE